MEKRYWLRVGNLPWQEATKEEFIQSERAEGFNPKPDCGEVATGGFSGGAVQGRITDGDTDSERTKERYGWDPEFLKAITASN